jgi:hypothetical protein
MATIIQGKHVPSQFTNILFAFFMSMFMAFIISGVLTMIDLGPVAGFLLKWMRAFGIAWMFAVPSVLLVTPLARRLVEGITSRQWNYRASRP